MRKTFSAVALERRRRSITVSPGIGSQGWNKSTADPMLLLNAYKPLRIRSGYVLRAYQYISGEDGNGVIYAMPSDSAFPEPPECESAGARFLHPPLPRHADRSFMSYIEGGDSVRSYMLASILARELLEFGARRHGCSWSLERLIPGDLDVQLPPPAVELDQNGVKVLFSTCDNRGRVVQYTDTYEFDRYTFRMDAMVVACGS